MAKRSEVDDVVAYLRKNGTMRSVDISDGLNIPMIRMVRIMTQGCSSGAIIRVTRACRGHQATYGVAGSIGPGPTITQRIAELIASSSAMLSARQIAKTLHIRENSARTLALGMADRGQIIAVRHGKFTFFCRDLDCTDPVATRPNPNPTGKTRIVPRKKPLILRPIGKEQQKAIPAPPPKPVGIGSTQYGAYIGSAKNPRAPWLDMSGWEEPSAMRIQKVGFSDNAI